MNNLRIIYMIFILFASSVSASDVKIIELHSSKSLDQLVLDSTNEANDNKTEILDNTNENLPDDQKLIEDETAQKNEESNDQDPEDISNKEIEIINTETIFDLNEDILNIHLSSIKKIKSKILNQEFIKILSNTKLDDDNFSEDKIFYIIKKLYEIGEIQKAYNLVKEINYTKINNKDILNYFYFIEINYLYSSFQLQEACELKTLLIEKNIFLPKNLLEKTDIFCLTLENNNAEAELLNSVLLESELETDQNFQRLFNYMILKDQSDISFESLSKIKSKELIFLYSAMLRINELPLDKDFIEIDPLNLSIPVILSKSTQMNTRIQAAHKAFYDGSLSINSLSALYQSVDFNSQQLNDPEKTISSLDSKELIMAYYYQLANIQIFPDDRLDIILKYWDFAIQSGLEKIAYAITEKIIETFTASVENSDFAMKIAYAHISNSNYDDAEKWIKIYEISNPNDDNINYAKFLINLNKNDDLDTIVNYLVTNYNNFSNINDQATLESIEVLKNFLVMDSSLEQKISYNNILDTRQMPTYFLMKDIEYNMTSKNDISIILLSIISLNNKNWIELHPQHLKLILNSINLYENGLLIKEIVLEILNELDIFE